MGVMAMASDSSTSIDNWEQYRHAEPELQEILTEVPVPIEVVDATVCGAAGCHETDLLLQATVSEYGSRVLCPDHLEQLVEREVSNS